MLKIFQQTNLFSAAILLLLLIILRLFAFTSDYLPDISASAPLANLLFARLKNLENYHLISIMAAASFIYIQALFVNYMGSSHNILYKHSYLPSLFYVILNSIYKEQLYLSPQIISNTFFIIMVFRLCSLYENNKPILLILDCGMLLGIAILFNYDAIVFLPFILLSVVSITNFNLRYVFAAVLGILIPIYFATVLFFLFNNIQLFKQSVINSFSNVSLKAIDIGYLKNIPLFVIIPVFFISLIKLQFNFFKNNVKTRRLLFMMGLLAVFGSIMLFLDNISYVYATCYISVAISFAMAYFFLTTKRLIFKEILIWLLIIAVISSHYIS